MINKFMGLSLVWKIITGIVCGVVTLASVVGASIALEDRFVNTSEQATYDQVLHLELSSEFAKRDKEIELLAANLYEQYRAGIVNQIGNYQAQIRMIHNRAAAENRGLSPHERATINMLQQEIQRLQMQLRG